MIPEELRVYFVESSLTHGSSKRYLQKEKQTTKYIAVNGQKPSSWSSFNELEFRRSRFPTYRRLGDLYASKKVHFSSQFEDNEENLAFDSLLTEESSRGCEGPSSSKQSANSTTADSFFWSWRKKKGEKLCEEEVEEREEEEAGLRGGGEEGREESVSNKRRSLKMLSYIVPGEEKASFPKSDISNYASLSEDPSPVSESRPLLGEELSSSKSPTLHDTTILKHSLCPPDQMNALGATDDPQRKVEGEGGLPTVQVVTEDQSPVVSEPMSLGSDLATPGSDDKSIIKSSSTKPSLKR